MKEWYNGGCREIQGTKRKKRERWFARGTVRSGVALQVSWEITLCSIRRATSSSACASIPCTSRRSTSRRIIPCLDGSIHPRLVPTPETSYVIIQILLTFLYHIARRSQVGRPRRRDPLLNVEPEVRDFFFILTIASRLRRRGGRQEQNEKQNS